jgi:uncharacterized membrane protein YbhN (UPF0104 family)
MVREMKIDHERDPSDPTGQTDSVSAHNGVTGNRPGNRHRALTVGFSLIVFVASVWYIGRTFQWVEIGQVLRHVNLTCLIAGGGASIVAYWMLRTLRWHILLRRTDTHVPLLDLYLCTTVSLSFALFTPLQSGEILKIELLKKHGLIQRSPGYGSFLVERALDLVTLLTMACVSLLTTINILPSRTYIYYILGGLVLLCAAGLIVLTKLELKGWSQRLREHMYQCVGDVPTLVLVTAITCVSWASVAFSWQVFLYSGGLHLGFAKAMALMSIVALISILSLIPGGIGISEAGTSQLLMHFGFAVATAQAGSLVLRSYSLVAIALGVGHLGLWKLIRSHRRLRLETVTRAIEPLAAEADPSCQVNAARKGTMNKRIAILQSNYIPWKGYFDLINNVDEFILYDTVQFTKNDWRNRNKIKTAQGPAWLTIPVRHNFGQLIQDVQLSDPKWAQRHWKTLVQQYAKATCFAQYKPVFEQLYANVAQEKYLSVVNYRFISEICGILGITTRITWSRDYQMVDGQTECLVHLCQQAGASEYLSGPAAKDYIQEDLFRHSGIKLTYIDYSGYPEYDQLNPPFEHGVSILDLIFNLGHDAPKYMKSFGCRTADKTSN